MIRLRGVIVALSICLLAGSMVWGFLPGIEDLLGGSAGGGETQPIEVPAAVYVVGEASDGSKIFEGWMEPNKDYSGIYKGENIRITSKPEWGTTGFFELEGTWQFGFVVYYPSATHNVVITLDGEVSLDPEGSSWKALDVRWESQSASQEGGAEGLSEVPMPIDNIILQLAKMKEKHFSVHVWGEKSAPVDMEIARRIKDAEIEIGTDGSTLGQAVGFKAVPYAGEALSQAACQWHKVEDIKASPIPGITFDMDQLADSLTNAWMNLKDTEETIPDEEKKTLFLVSYGGPAVNQHAQRYAMDKGLPLYFDRDEKGWKIVDRMTGKEYRSGEYGLVIALPRVRSISLPELYAQIEQYDGQILLYRVIIAGNTRVGTRAAGDWYADTLEASNQVLEKISDFVCGSLSQEQLAAGLASGGLDYLLESISLEGLGEMQQAVEGYVKVMLLTSLDKKTELKEVMLPGYAALVKADGDGGKVVKIYPVM